MEGFGDLTFPLDAVTIAEGDVNAAALGQAGSRSSRVRESGVKVEKRNTAGILSPSREVDVSGVAVSLPSKGKSVEASATSGIPSNRASSGANSVYHGRRGTLIL